MIGRRASLLLRLDGLPALPRAYADLGEAPPAPAPCWLFRLRAVGYWLAEPSVATGGGRRVEGLLSTAFPQQWPRRPAPPRLHERRPRLAPPGGRSPASARLGLAPPPAAVAAPAAARPAAGEDEGDRGLRGVPEGLAALQVPPGKGQPGAVRGDRPRGSCSVLGAAQGAGSRAVGL